MKIMIINSLYHPYKFGGAEVSVQLLAESLAEKGHLVRIITLNDKDEIIRDSLNGVDIVSLPLRNVYWPFSLESHNFIKKIMWHLKDSYNLKMMAMVDTEIKNYNPDIIHTNNLAGFSAGVWNVINRRKYPLIHTIRDYYLFHPNSTLFKNGSNINPKTLSVKIFSLLKKRISQKIDVVVGISKFISSFHYSNGYSREAKFYHVYNPIDKIIIPKDKRNKILTIGFVGRLTSEKGFDVFLDYVEKYQGVMRFVVAGKAAPSIESDELLKRALALKVNILGYVPIDQFLKQVDALLLPTKWNEPFGRVVAEAALSKTPIFTNLTGGVKEISELFPWILPLEQFGEPKVNSLLDELLIEKIYDNPFDKRKHADNYLELYRDLISSYKTR